MIHTILVDDWMTATGKIKPPKIRRVKLTIPEEDKPSNDPNENGGDGLGPDVNQNEMPNGKEGKRRSSKLLSGFKSGVSRVLHTMGISGTKPKLKIDARFVKMHTVSIASAKADGGPGGGASLRRPFVRNFSYCWLYFLWLTGPTL